MQKWLKSVDNSPGITQVALDAISEKVSSYKNQGISSYVCLVNDDVTLRKQVQFNESNMSFEGFSEIANSNKRKRKKNDAPIVKEALVYMVVGIDFRITVAYQLTAGMNAIDRAAFTKEVIRCIDLTGAKVISLTGDGLYANMAVAKLLGAQIEDKKPHFPRPNHPTEKIYVIFDPPHMVKLLRKYLCKQNLCHENDELKWDLLNKLAAKQDRDNFSLTNKLTQNHINWEDHKMNVKKAIQIFSNENADALEQLCDDLYEGFLGSEKLVKFLRLCNNIIDVFNFGEGKKSDDHFKQPLCASTIDKFRKLFESFEQFVDKMTIEIKRKKASKREPARKQMGFAGMMINIQSSIGIYEDYIKKSRSGVFYTFQYAQDHLETYFSLVRSCLGCNNNPNVQQFQAAYRKLLFCAPHISGESKTNCNIDFPNELLNMSSGIKSIPQSLKRFNALTGAQTVEIEMDYNTFINIEMEPYERHIYALVASDVEEKMGQLISKQTVSSCQDCLNVFRENTKTFDGLISKKIARGALKTQPCSSTLNIILVSEGIIKNLQAHALVDYATVAKTIFNKLSFEFESLYESSSFECHQQNETIQNSQIMHKEQFILEVLRTFLNMKSKKICGRISLEEQAQAREKSNKRRNRILAGK